MKTFFCTNPESIITSIKEKSWVVMLSRSEPHFIAVERIQEAS